jgi:hypothetical protein
MTPSTNKGRNMGFDHGAGHPLLFLDDAKAPLRNPSLKLPVRENPSQGKIQQIGKKFHEQTFFTPSFYQC